MILKRIKKLGLEEFEDHSLLMKTIQPFNDPSKITFSLPAPTYTSTDSNTLKDKLKRGGNFPDISKNIFDYRNQYSGASEDTVIEDDNDSINNRHMLYGNRHGNLYNSKEKNKQKAKAYNKSEDYQYSPYLQNNNQLKKNNSKIKKTGSQSSVLSIKKSATESEPSNQGVKLGSPIELDLNDKSKEPNMSKIKSQESLAMDVNIKQVNVSSPDAKSKIKQNSDQAKEKESRLSSGHSGDDSQLKQKIIAESVTKKAIEPSEFKMKSDANENISPTKRLIEQNKARMKLDQSKEVKRNDSQSQLSAKKLNRNDSQRELSNDNILANSDRNENTKSKKLIKNLREQIALKLYEHNVPASNYNRVIGKGSLAGNNSYIQKMLDAYNVFNYPHNSNTNKYNNKIRKNLRNSKNKSKYNDEGLISPERNNRSLVEKNNSRNNLSPGYPREKSVVLPELSRSPAINLISNRKKSIVNLKKKTEKYGASGPRNNAIPPIGSNLNNSTELDSMPSISKQLDRILNSHKMNIVKNVKKNSKNSEKYHSPNHFKINSISNENDRRELALDGLPSAISKPNKKNANRELRNEAPVLSSITEQKNQ